MALFVPNSHWFSAKIAALFFPLPADKRKVPVSHGVYFKCKRGVINVSSKLWWSILIPADRLKLSKLS